MGRNLSRLILKLDENLTDITLVYDGGVFTLFNGDKKTPGHNEKEIKTILQRLDAVALDLPTRSKKDVDAMVSFVKNPSTSSQIDLAAPVKELSKFKFS
jgi:hypothetical protein